MGEVPGGIEPAAAHQRVCCADRPGMFENRSQVVFIIFFEEGTVNDAKDVPLVLLPIALDQLSGDGFQLKSETDAA